MQFPILLLAMMVGIAAVTQGQSRNGLPAP